MTKVVPIDMLRIATRDAVLAYETVKLAEAITPKSKSALDAAENLLRQAKIVFTAENSAFTDVEKADWLHLKGRHEAWENYAETGTARYREGGSYTFGREVVVDDYVEVLRAYADLEIALEQLVQAQVETNAWQDASATVEVLAALGAGKQRCDALQEKIGTWAFVDAERSGGSPRLAIERLQTYTNHHPFDDASKALLAKLRATYPPEPESPIMTDPPEVAKPALEPKGCLVELAYAIERLFRM